MGTGLGDKFENEILRESNIATDGRNIRTTSTKIINSDEMKKKQTNENNSFNESFDRTQDLILKNTTPILNPRTNLNNNSLPTHNNDLEEELINQLKKSKNLNKNYVEDNFEEQRQEKDDNFMKVINNVNTPMNILCSKSSKFNSKNSKKMIDLNDQSFRSKTSKVSKASKASKCNSQNINEVFNSNLVTNNTKFELNININLNNDKITNLCNFSNLKQDIQEEVHTSGDRVEEVQAEIKSISMKSEGSDKISIHSQSIKNQKEEVKSLIDQIFSNLGENNVKTNISISSEKMGVTDIGRDFKKEIDQNKLCSSQTKKSNRMERNSKKV